ncbi:hypothetical protein N0V93_004423 [Gnomoniopsis smithogilvyi]|uniref:C2H2-type domain-containing protein n=1 Tax=Gnomoniopsis smithogilvyi TaxID=1191159 RepID=A0A9W8YUS8_9PEZI|nr:hypothetical protein N0V93_004423 [Gnomoniopsis smithogilvyi]
MDASSSPQSWKSISQRTIAKRATFPPQDNKEYHEASRSRSKSVDSPNARFACHFLIANPHKLEANAICARTTWPSIPRLKEHLYRRHGQQRPSCARCACTFEKEKDLDEHLRAEKPCKISDRPSQSISPAQMHMLKRRKGQYNGSEFNKWFEIWDLLFPDRPRPNSPYLDARDGICGWGLRVMDDLQQFVERRVATTVLDKLEKNHVISGEQLKEQRRIKALISESVGSAFKEYTNQHERVTELHEEPEEIPQSSNGYKHQGIVFTDTTTSKGSTLSPSNSTISTDLSENTDYSTMSMCFPAMDNTWMTTSPEHSDRLDFAPQMCTTSITRMLDPDFVREYYSEPILTSYQHVDDSFWLGDSTFPGNEFRNGSQDAADGGSVDFSSAIFRP